MKILFLDIDGVLNNKRTREVFNGYTGIDESLVPLVKEIIDRTGAKVVLSSAWRLHERHALEVFNKVVEYIDTTPDLSSVDKWVKRGDEINAWLRNTKYAPDVYAILDDMDDFYSYQPLFQTNPSVGITQEIVEKVVSHLNNTPEARRKQELIDSAQRMLDKHWKFVDFDGYEDYLPDDCTEEEEDAIYGAVYGATLDVDPITKLRYISAIGVEEDAQ